MVNPDFVGGFIIGFLIVLLLFLIANEDGAFDTPKIKRA